MHKTLYNITRGQVPSKRFTFLKGASVFVEGGGCHSTVAQWPVQACGKLTISHAVVVKEI